MYLSCSASLGESVETRSPLQSLIGDVFTSPGLLWEWSSQQLGAGVQSLVSQLFPFNGDHWVVVDHSREFYPLWCLQPNARQPQVIRPRSRNDGFWVIEECLRSKAVNLLWSVIERVPPLVYRRWKLAAEAGGGTAMFFRAATPDKQPSWADLRWAVTPLTGTPTTRRWRTELRYCRKGFADRATLWEQQHGTGVVRMVSELADTTTIAGSPLTPRATAGVG